MSSQPPPGFKARCRKSPWTKEDIDYLLLGDEMKKQQDDGLFECRNCKSKDVKYRMEQTRSGDEGMTTIFRCESCNKQWSA